MNNNIPIIEIELEVLWHNEESRKLQELDIDYSPDDCERKIMTFYSINAISPHIWYEREFTNIHSGGGAWIATKSYDEIKKLIKDKLKPYGV